MCAALCNPPDQEPTGNAERPQLAENRVNIKHSQLTRRQILALPILAAAANLTQAARDAGISESTLYRWRQNEHFRNELQRLTAETADLTRQEMETLTRKSSQVLSDLMQDPDPMVRLRAARAVAVMGVQVSEAHTRLQSIEPPEKRPGESDQHQIGHS